MGLPKLAFRGGRTETTTIFYPAPAPTTGRPRPGPAGISADYNESLPFSAQLRAALKTFLASNL
jgi:hypothetical protein